MNNKLDSFTRQENILSAIAHTKFPVRYKGSKPNSSIDTGILQFRHTRNKEKILFLINETKQSEIYIPHTDYNCIYLEGNIGTHHLNEIFSTLADMEESHAET